MAKLSKRHHHLVIVFAPPDLDDAQPHLKRAVESASAAVSRDGLAFDFRTLDDLPPGLDAGGVEARFGEQLNSTSIVVLALKARFDASTVALAEHVLSYWQTNRRPWVMAFVAKDAGLPRPNRSQRLELEELDNYIERLTPFGLVGSFGDSSDLERKLSVALIELAPKLPTEDPPQRSLPIRPYFDWLVKQHATLTIPGMSGTDLKRFPLDQVFVKLRLRGRGLHAAETVDKEALRGAARRLDLDLADVLPRSAPLAIVGDPGAGKTTLLRYVALHLGRAALGTAPEGARDLGYPEEPPSPILVNLREAVRHLEQLGHGDSEALPIEAWASVLELTLSQGGVVAKGHGRELLMQGGLLLMFDGLDEVAGERTRARLAKALTALADVTADGRPNRLVVTCRTRAWGEDPAFGRFEEALVLPLDEAGLRAFARKWADAAGPLHDTAGTGRAAVTSEELESAIVENRMVRRIATNPQMLTMLAALYAAQRKLPPERAALYRECVEWLLHRREDALEPYGGPQAALRAHTELARALQTATDDNGKSRQALERFDAAKVLLKHLRAQAEGAEQGERDSVVGSRASNGGTGQRPPAEAKRRPAASRVSLDDALEYLRILELYVGLVVASGSEVRFHHRTFQEYLVARWIADHEDPAAVLGDRADDPQWLEVVALTAGILAEQGETRLRAYLQALVPTGGSVETRAPRVGVMAQCLEDLSAWSLSEHVLAPAKTALQEVLPIFQDAAQKTPEKVRIAVAEGLGRTKDPRLTKALRWVHVPAGRFWRGAAPDDELAYEDEKPAGWVHVSEFFIQRWAVTVGEYRAFMELGGYEARRWWSDGGWAWREEAGAESPANWTDQRDAGSRPVIGVSWWEAEAYCRWMTEERHLLPKGCRVVRLPTEAEWEKAARGGEVLPGGAPNPEVGRRYAWVGDFDGALCNSESRIGQVTPVGCFPGSHGALGLWDATGNVWEWCLDGCAEGRPQPYEHAEDSDPVFGDASLRVFRGGAWGYDPRGLRVSCRDGIDPWYRFDRLGFRVLASPGRSPLDP